jgi:hypothetical protein
MKKKPNAWELEGWDNVVSAIWLHAYYQDFERSVYDSFATRYTEKGTKPPWTWEEHCERIKFDTEGHRKNFVQLLRFMSP